MKNPPGISQGKSGCWEGPTLPPGEAEEGGMGLETGEEGISGISKVSKQHVGYATSTAMDPGKPQYPDIGIQFSK